MDFYHELESYKNLDAQIIQMEAYQKKLDEGSEKALYVQTLITYLRALQNELKSHYTPVRENPKKEYRKLTERNLFELNNLYDLSKTMMQTTKEVIFTTDEEKADPDAGFFSDVEKELENDGKILGRISEKDPFSLPLAAYKAQWEIQNGQNDPNLAFKWPGFFEYETLFLDDPNMKHEDVLKKYIEGTPESISKEYRDAVDGSARLYEYPPGMENIDPAIRNTGNVQKINEYLEADEKKQNEDEKLTYRQREMLIHHRDATRRVEEINASIQQNLAAGNELGAKPVLTENENGIELDVHQTAFQTSGTGCWSCSGAMMASSRGIANVTQEEIRAYRPDISGDEVVNNNDEVDANYSRDDSKSVLDNADSILKFAPNSMLHTLEIQNHSIGNEKDGVNAAQYTANAVNLLKKQIDHALRVDRSPVAFFTPGHYITIIGLDGDTVKFKDSRERKEHNGNPDQTLTAPLKSLVEKSFFNGRPQSIEINWLSDIKLAKDNKTLHGVPSEYVYLKDDGTVTQQPLAMREAMGTGDGHKLKRMGFTVVRPSEDENVVLDRSGKNFYGKAGVQMAEKVYLPKDLNVEYLKKMAAKRDPAEEEKLNEADRNIYNIGPDKKDPEMAEPEMQRKLQANKAAENSKDDRIIISQTMDDSLLTTGGEAKNAFRKVFQSHFRSEERKRLLREKKLIANKEKARAEELKNYYTYSKINATANVLLEKMETVNPWYLPGKNNAYKDVIGSLQTVRKYAGRFDDQMGRRGLREEDVKKFVTAVDNVTRLSRKYLSDKQKEMERDLLQKNDPGKAEYEQNRMDAMLDVYDFFSEISLMLKGRENPKGILQRDEERKVLFNHFLKELVSYEKDPQGAQDASTKDRLYIPEKNKPILNRLESLFGTKPRTNQEFANVEGINTLPNMENPFVKIGSGNMPNPLSEKDFVALSIAASTTPDALQDQWKTGDPEVRYTTREKMDYYAGQTLFNIIHANHQSLPGDIVGIQRSRALAKVAMLNYAAGNKDELARLIANGIKNLSAIISGGRFAKDKTMQLYASEMGLRMKGMLERDPELMKKAMEYGLKPEMIKKIKNRGARAVNSCLAERWNEDGKKPAANAWGIREKERNYVDMLMDRYLEEARTSLDAEMKSKPEYKEKIQAIKQRSAVELEQAKEIYDKARINALKDTTKYKEFEGMLRDGNQMPLMKGSHEDIRNAEKNIRNTMIESMDKIADILRTNNEKYENALITKHEQYIRDHLANDLPGGYDNADRRTKLNKALTRERELMAQEAPADAEKRAQFIQDKKMLDSYQANEEGLRNYAVAQNQYTSKTAAIREARKIGLDRVERTMAPENPILNELSDAGKERALRNRFLKYIRGNGYDQYSPKQFVERVVGNGQERGTERKAGLLIDLKLYEQRAIEKKAGVTSENKEAKEIDRPKQKEAVTNKTPKTAKVQKPAGRTLG